MAIGEGIARGKAKIYRHTPIVVERKRIAKSQVKREHGLLDQAFQRARTALERRRGSHLEGEALEILETHLLLLQDPTYITSIKEKIEDKLINAAWATEEVTEGIVKTLEASDDELFRQRTIDINDIGDLSKHLCGKSAHPSLVLDEPVILLADTLLPSELFSLDRSNILGLSLDGGGLASHVAILAWGWNIPPSLKRSWPPMSLKMAMM